MLRLLIGFLTSIAFLGCSESPRQSNENAQSEIAVPEPRRSSGFELEPALRRADSLQILYFDDPDGDSSRYMRYFTYSSLVDSSSVSVFLSNIDSSFTQQEVVRNCRSQGKIYVFGNGRELKTIYFSTGCDNNCCYIYFIKNGLFNYFNLSGDLRRLIESEKKRAKKP